VNRHLISVNGTSATDGTARRSSPNLREQVQHDRRYMRARLRVIPGTGGGGVMPSRGGSAANEAAKWWLLDYMTDAGGEALARDGIAAGTAAGFTAPQLATARNRLGVTTTQTGHGPRSFYTWNLDLSVSHERPVQVGYAMACERPTAKFPDGRTGTPAGYGAHRKAGEEPCRACTDAFSAASAERRRSLSPEEAEREREMRNGYARDFRQRERDAGRANGAENRYFERQKALGLQNVARDKFMATSREIMREAKSAPCADCGVRYPYYVMQFDHVPERGPKLFNVGHIGPTCSREKLLAEIAKCDVVCSNCHAERTFQRGQFGRKRSKPPVEPAAPENIQPTLWEAV
jgi:hypothetical protein